MPASDFPSLSRRGFVVGAAAIGGGLALPTVAAAAPAPRLVDPFTLGVASGDPLPDSVVLWTRLAPEPLADGGGVPNRPVPVRWELAADENFRRIVQRGTELARPEEAHTVHIDVRGLEPHREYWYRFRTGNEVSPVGRTRTAPAPGSLAPLSFAFASCSHYEMGYFTAYKHLAAENPDVVFHLGDYVYEYAGATGRPRTHAGNEMNTLAEYRQRHAQYKTDPDLQAAHRAAPFIVTWDDHETDNNYADLVPENNDPNQGNATRETFAVRRAAAYQAYWEHMPLRRFRKPVDTNLPLYRGFDYGGLARFSVLDTRQYRDDQPYGDRSNVNGPEQWETDMLGSEQHAWLEKQLTGSDAVWNIVPQQIFFANMDTNPAGPGSYNDGWDGYQASRDRILGLVEEREIENFVVLTGDVHNHWMVDLRRDFENDSLPLLGSEIVCTSVTSNGDGRAWTDAEMAVWKGDMPYLHYRSNLRGYVKVDVTPDTLQADFMTVDKVSVPGLPISTDASYVIESGQVGAQPA
ncbi:alkaline phosphatase D family protein [Propionibacteriaceae bacterium Y2011]